MPAPRTICRNARLLAVTLLVVGSQLLAPPRADAWFGWLDKYSGPGPFKGVLFDLRVWCLGDDSGVRRLEEARNAAESASVALRALIPPPGVPIANREALVAAHVKMQQAWVSLLKLIRDADAKYPVTLPGATDAIETALVPVQRVILTRAFDTYVVPLRQEEVQTLDPDYGRHLEELIKGGVAATDAVLNQRKRAIIGLGGAGVELSLCDEHTRRWISVELNADVWRTIDKNAQFAAGEHVWLTTLMPSVMFHPSFRPSRDIVDVGVAAGAYLFASKGFDDFAGWVVQPRIDLHGPTAWHAYPRTDVRRLAAALTLRFGLNFAPQGFDPGQFGPDSPRIEPEWVPTLAVFLNFSSLFR
jgi:hypothetical protein